MINQSVLMKNKTYRMLSDDYYNFLLRQPNAVVEVSVVGTTFFFFSCNISNANGSSDGDNNIIIDCEIFALSCGVYYDNL